MLSRPFRKVRSVNSNSSGFATLAPEFDLSPSDAGTAAGRAVISLTPLGGMGAIPKAIDVFPYGLGANNDAFTMRLVGWRRVLPIVTDGWTMWLPSIIGDVICTMGNFTGLASGPVLNTEFFCDTLTKSVEPTKTGNTTLLDGKIWYYSPANDTPGHVIFPLEGFEAIEFYWDQTTNTPTMNALYALQSKE